MDGQCQQSGSDKHMQALVPVRGAGEKDHRLAQERLLWSETAASLPWSRKNVDNLKLKCFMIITTPYFKRKTYSWFDLLLFRHVLWIVEAKSKAENTQLSSNLDPLSAALGPRWPSRDQDGGRDWRRPPLMEASGLEEAGDTTGWVKDPLVRSDLRL